MYVYGSCLFQAASRFHHPGPRLSEHSVSVYLGRLAVPACCGPLGPFPLIRLTRSSISMQTRETAALPSLYRTHCFRLRAKRFSNPVCIPLHHPQARYKSRRIPILGSPSLSGFLRLSPLLAACDIQRCPVYPALLVGRCPSVSPAISGSVVLLRCVCGRIVEAPVLMPGLDVALVRPPVAPNFLVPLFLPAGIRIRSPSHPMTAR